MVKASYKIGDKIKMSEAALKNYGETFRGRVFEIVHVARNQNEHPGFDENCGTALYDFKGLNFSLYEWEMERA